MKDGIIKADGTSRLVRSVADFKTKYPTYADFAAALVAGTLPMDILFNAAGWTQLPTFLNKANLLQDATAALYGLGPDAAPDDVFRAIGLSSWELIASYKEPGAFEFVVPDGGEEIGAYLAGAGGDGGLVKGTTTYRVATGGSAGYGKNIVLQAIPGQVLSGIVGDRPGGTTSFAGITVAGGVDGSASQSSEVPYHASLIGSDGGQASCGCSSSISSVLSPFPLFGSIQPPVFNTFAQTSSMVIHGGISQHPSESQNAFDTSMVTLCAGGCVKVSSATTEAQLIQAMPDGTKGGDGASGTLDGVDATGNGNGGGAVDANVTSTATRGGYGSPGMVLIYKRGHKK